MVDSGLVGSTNFPGRGAARAVDAQGTPTQGHVSPSILVYEDDQALEETMVSFLRAFSVLVNDCGRVGCGMQGVRWVGGSFV